jgi:hypothetical protein
MVARYVYWKVSSVNLRSSEDLPTELLPTMTILKR